MLDLAWSELLIIGVVALVAVGPKDLPIVLRTAGRWMGKARSMAREFQSSVDDMIREAELDELRKQVSDVGQINPLAALEKSLEVAAYPTPVTQEPPAVPQAKSPIPEPVEEPQSRHETPGPVSDQPAAAEAVPMAPVPAEPVTPESMPPGPVPAEPAPAAAPPGDPVIAKPNP
jgi:sec-independent protein translocase protein TatB